MSTVLPVELLWELYDYDPLNGKLYRKYPNGRKQLVTGYWSSNGRAFQAKITQFGKELLGTAYGRIVYAWVHGHWPVHQVDHINRDPSNNRAWNLRDVTPRVNNQNKSNFRGAAWSKFHSKWRAVIKLNGKQKHLGYYTELKDAQKAYWDAVNEQTRNSQRQVLPPHT